VIKRNLLQQFHNKKISGDNVHFPKKIGDELISISQTDPAIRPKDQN
jgi:hypothetical protein